MPTCRRKRVVLTEPSQELVRLAKTKPDFEVFYLHETGEIFETYEAYAARMSFYRLKQFQCEVTGKSGLDYFQAVESEREEAYTLHERFSEPLKYPVLKAVQWQVMGRLDHLVEAVFERFKDRYFKDEKVVLDLDGVKYFGRVQRVYPPRFSSDEKARDAYKDSDSSDQSLDEEEPHSIGANLNLPLQDANRRDDPELYYYWVEITGIEKDKGEKTKGSKATDKDAGMVGSVMEVQCSMMSRDRLSFSKSILRRFIRDCVDRDAAVASPWTVKPLIAEHYGVKSIMPEEIRKGVEDIKKGEIDKRKKAWEDKEGPPTKKQKKMTAAQEEKAKTSALIAEKKEREAREKAEKERLAKEEAERIAAEKKKKKPVRYPTEDLDVRISEKDKKAGVPLKRPPGTRNLPFTRWPGAFESLLMSWNFLVVYGQPLHLSALTLDELICAIQHTVPDLPCPLLAEIHSTLIYNLRTVSFTRHSAILSLLHIKDELGENHRMYNITIDELTNAMADVGNNWERVPLRHAEGREGWEDALIGCIKDHANLDNFPRLREVLTQLFFAPEAPETNGRLKTPPLWYAPETTQEDLEDSKSIFLTVPSTPAERYYDLCPEDRIAILTFLCNLAVSSKAIHTYIESCEEQLTALRKEKIEVNRLKKQYLEEMNVLADEANPGKTNTNGVDTESAMPDDSELSDTSGSQSTSRRTSKKQETRTAHSKLREAARAKQASQKQALAEHRRLDEEVNKIERRLEGIERDFRKLLGGVRIKPLGKDRFYNRVWWFDGLGSASLVGSGGVAQYGTGRIFIQGPSETDLLIMSRREDDDIPTRRVEEEGEVDILGPGDWAAYSSIGELEEYLAWLNPKGHRELALKTAMTKWWSHITSGMKKRHADLDAPVKASDARRSSRNKSGPADEYLREPYMQWTNRKAVNGS